MGAEDFCPRFRITHYEFRIVFRYLDECARVCYIKKDEKSPLLSIDLDYGPRPVGGVFRL